jgi:hypothetical protein
VTIRQTDGLGAPLIRQMAVEYIADPASYAGGPKIAQVLSFGTCTRTLSDIKGRLQGASFSIRVGDPDGTIRGWFANAVQRNMTGLEVSIDFRLGTDRLAGIIPAPCWHGLIKSYASVPGGSFQFEAWSILDALNTTSVPMPRIGDYFPQAKADALDRLGPRWYGHLSDEQPGGGAGVVSWRAAVSLSSFNADVTLPTDGLVVAFNTVDAPAQILINGVTVAEVTLTQGNSIGVPYSAGQTLRINSSSGSGLLVWFFGLDGETWGAPVTLTLDADFTEAAHGMVLLYNPGSQGGVYTLGGVDYAEVVASFTFPSPGTGASANAPYLAGQTGHITSSGGSGLVATFYPFTGGATWSAPMSLPIDGTDFTEVADGLVQLYDAGNETGTYTMAGTSFLQANEVYHMAAGCPYQNGQTARVTPWGGSNLFAWFFALNGSSPVSGASPKGVVPPINVSGPWVDLLGEPWDLGYVVAAHAVKGNFTVYSRDTNNVVTPLASLDDAQISVPGRTGFATRWGATSYRVVNGRRWTLLYVRGALAAALTAGSVTLWVNFDGVEDVGDGSGTLIESVLQQKAHIWDNDIDAVARGVAGYAGGNWTLSIPVFGDGRPTRNAASYAAAQASLEAALGASDVGAWGLTASTSCIDVLAQLSVDCDTAQGPDADGALEEVFEMQDPNAEVLEDGLTEVSEIKALSVSFTDRTTNDYLFNQLTYTFGAGWDASGSPTSPTTATITNTVGVTDLRGLTIPCSETLNFMARRDATAAGLIATRLLNRAAPAPRDLTVVTGLFALSLVTLGSLVPITHSELPVDQAWRVRGIDVNWDTGEVTLVCREPGLINTTLLVDDQVAEYRDSDQGVGFTATVVATPPPSVGTVTFQLYEPDGVTPIGSPATSGTVAAGAAAATYTVPGGTGA